MSWSYSARGTTDEIRTQARSWPALIAETDATSQGLTPEAKNGHKIQAEAAVNVIDLLATAFADTLVSLHANGHANQDGSGNMGVSYTLAKI